MLDSRQLIRKGIEEYKAKNKRKPTHIIVSFEFMAIITDDVLESEELDLVTLAETEITEIEGLKIAVSADSSFNNFLIVR
jgi:hypothetical protein